MSGQHRHDSRPGHGLLALLRKPAVLVLFSAILTVGLLEGLSALMLKRMDQTPAGLAGATLARLYETDDPARLAEIQAMLAETWGGRQLQYDPLDEYREAPFAGRYVTEDSHGVRANNQGEQPWPPKPGALSVFVFGGSTTFGYGVANQDTIPAQLQAALLRDHGVRAEVYNLGNAFDYSTIERIRFEKLATAGILPRVAVFIDGLNDFYFLDMPDRSAQSDMIEYRSRRFTYGFLVRKVAALVAESSRTVRLGRRLMEGAQARPAAPAASADMVENAARRLVTNRRLVQAMCRELGILPVFVQQPVPTFHYDNARRPGGFKADQLKAHAASGPGYEMLERWRAQGVGAGPDILHLQDFGISGNQYVDSVHYSPNFNRAIAGEIARHIAARLAATPPQRTPLQHRSAL